MKRFRQEYALFPSEGHVLSHAWDFFFFATACNKQALERHLHHLIGETGGNLLAALWSSNSNSRHGSVLRGLEHRLLPSFSDLGGCRAVYHTFFLTVHHFYGIFPLNTLSSSTSSFPEGSAVPGCGCCGAGPASPHGGHPSAPCSTDTRDGETRYGEHSGHLRESRDVKHAPLRNDECFLVFLDGECRFSPPTEGPFFSGIFWNFRDPLQFKQVEIEFSIVKWVIAIFHSHS